MDTSHISFDKLINVANSLEARQLEKYSRRRDERKLLQEIIVEARRLRLELSKLNVAARADKVNQVATDQEVNLN